MNSYWDYGRTLSPLPKLVELVDFTEQDKISLRCFKYEEFDYRKPDEVWRR